MSYTSTVYELTQACTQTTYNIEQQLGTQYSTEY